MVVVLVTKHASNLDVVEKYNKAYDMCVENIEFDEHPLLHFVDVERILFV